MRKRPSHHANGFSRFEFIALVAAGLLVAALLAHFVIDQSIQVQRLRALVHRDGVRLNFESRLMNAEVIRKSAQATTTPDTLSLRACVLGDTGNSGCPDKNNCCVRGTHAVPILDLGNDLRLLGGSLEAPACLNEEGEGVQRKNPSSTAECFALASVVLEPVCPDGLAECHHANAVLIHYRLEFLPDFLRADPELSKLQRTISLVLD